MATYFRDLAFHPAMAEIVSPEARGQIAIFTGGNNSGKSAYLKKTIENSTNLYIGVNRFYSFHHLGLFTEDKNEKDSWYNNMNHQAHHQQYQNFEGSYFNCSTAITRLTNNRRAILFEVFEELFGIPCEVLPEVPDNEFSNKFVSVGGDSLSVTSSGTRLFLGVLAALMDDRFTSVAIDEPELGLSPTLQRRLADIMIRGEYKDRLFPHNPNIILSTHSHLFLDKNFPSNNYIVSKSGNLISCEPCNSMTDLHHIQFRLLGNDLSQLYLPDIVIFVEGETDKKYLEKILLLHHPDARTVVQQCSGDIAARLNYWCDSLGDMQVSPYRNRTIVVYDSVKQAGIERICARVGLPDNQRIEWTENGIEFVYPESILAEIFRKPGLQLSDLIINNDSVTVGDISYKKMALCANVCDRITNSTNLPIELQQKLLDPISHMLR